jgi:transposase
MESALREPENMKLKGINAGTEIHSLVRFARTLKQDLRAVELAVSEPWSNGLVEGVIRSIWSSEISSCRWS